MTFTNASNLSTIEVSAADEAGKPLAGATFAVFADHDADGTVAPGAQPTATCTTGADGACSMQVPTGSYVLVQTAAPAGLAPIEAVAFALTAGGQVAAVGVVNSPKAAAAPEAPAAAAPPPLVYQPPKAVAPPVERVAPLDPAPQPGVAPERDLGATVTRVVRAPADALRLLTRSPMEAAAWTASLTLLCLAAMAVTRRRQAMGLR